MREKEEGDMETPLAETSEGFGNNYSKEVCGRNGGKRMNSCETGNDELRKQI